MSAARPGCAHPVYARKATEPLTAWAALEREREPLAPELALAPHPPGSAPCGARNGDSGDGRRGARNDGDANAHNGDASAEPVARYRAVRQPAVAAGPAPLGPARAVAGSNRLRQAPKRRRYQLAEVC